MKQRITTLFAGITGYYGDRIRNSSSRWPGSLGFGPGLRGKDTQFPNASIERSCNAYPVPVIPASACYDLAMADSGCRPARCGTRTKAAIMKAAMTADAIGRLTLSPPLLMGLSSKSPTVAPSGRVRMNAAQNKSTWDTFVQ